MITFSPSQQTILEILKKSDLAKKFYLTGGTLLSYHYLHHRRSFDLDFFTETPFTYEELIPLLESVKKNLGVDQLEETKTYDRWEFIVRKQNTITRFEFVYYNHDKKRLSPLVTYQGLLIDSLPDLAANKVMAYIDRNQPKDMFDVYTLLKRRKFTVKKLLLLVEKKFGAQFSELLFWSEATKGFKLFNSLKPYLIETDPDKQTAKLQEIERFFLDGGSHYLNQQIK